MFNYGFRKPFPFLFWDILAYLKVVIYSWVFPIVIIPAPLVMPQTSGAGPRGYAGMRSVTGSKDRFPRSHSPCVEREYYTTPTVMK